jgi:phosphoribosyl-dephospho-CoA transferase
VSHAKYQRHDLVWLDPDIVVSQHACQEHADTVRNWLKQGFPLVVARQSDEEAIKANQIVLGFTLPSAPSRTRVMFRVNLDAIIRHSRPILLSETINLAPENWRIGLNRLVALFEKHEIVARVYGSLSSEVLTGMRYLDEKSDLDLLLELGEGTNLRALLADLENFPLSLPRIDGEILSSSGWAVAWRELATAMRNGTSCKVLAKSFLEIRLLPIEDFDQTFVIVA